MRFLLLTLLLLIPLPQYQYNKFDAVITDVTADNATVVADTCSPVVHTCKECLFPWPPPQTNCKHLTFQIALKDWPKYSNWPAKPVKGQLLKASLNNDGLLQSVADCATRRQAAMAEYCAEAGYACWQVSANAFMPDDCSRDISDFISEQVKVARQGN